MSWAALDWPNLSPDYPEPQTLSPPPSRPPVPLDIAAQVRTAEQRRGVLVPICALAGAALLGVGLALYRISGPEYTFALASMGAGLLVAFVVPALAVLLVIGPHWRQRIQHLELIRWERERRLWYARERARYLATLSPLQRDALGRALAMTRDEPWPRSMRESSAAGGLTTHPRAGPALALRAGVGLTPQTPTERGDKGQSAPLCCMRMQRTDKRFLRRQADMHIELGAHVFSQDGKPAGKVSKLIVDTSKEMLDSFVVHTQWMGSDLIVPINKVERVDADETIHLTITEEQFLQLPQYFVEKFVTNSASPGTEDYNGASRGMLPLSTPGLGSSTPVGQEWSPGSGPFIGYVDMTSSVVTTQSSLSENEFGITKGTKVLAGDGHHVGNVHELSVAEDGKLRGILVTSGHILTHQHFIPIEDVDDADSSAVYLRMSVAEFQALEQTDAPEAPEAPGDVQP
jgi:hypothetical protein